MKSQSTLSKLILHFRDGRSETFPVLEIRTDSTNLSIKDWMKEDQKTLFFSFLHQKLITQVDLTEVSPFVILQFDKGGAFTGASLKLVNSTSSFGILVQAKHVLILPFDPSFPLGNVRGIDLNQFIPSASWKD